MLLVRNETLTMINTNIIESIMYISIMVEVIYINLSS